MPDAKDERTEVNHLDQMPRGSAPRLGHIAAWLVFSIALVLWLSWAWLLAATYVAFGFGTTHDDYVWIIVTYALDPIVLLTWFKELRRDRMRAPVVLFIAIATVLSVWQQV